MSIIFKICSRALWAQAQAAGRFAGAPVDLADGFIHFSTGAQLRETARRHFSGQPDLVLLAVDGSALGAALRWEPSRGGDLFPHLYAPLLPAQVIAEAPLPLTAEGGHLFPDDPPFAGIAP